MQPMDIALRAYVCPNESEKEPKTKRKPHVQKKLDVPSEWVVVFDTETTTDSSQKLRFGTYQIRKTESLVQAGIFYDALTLTKAEQKLLTQYAAAHELTLLTVAEFVEQVFYGVGYDYRASIVGLNLPFDISRLAIDHSPARAMHWNKIMRGGFSLQLSPNADRPRVQIKHVSSRQSFIQYVATRGQRTTKGSRKKGQYEPVRRGYFVDIKTLAAALTSTSHSLESLAKAMRVESQKHETDEHGRTLTTEYIDYAVQDTQTTWECFVALNTLYTQHSLSLTAPHQILSEASLGKAYLKEMGIKPWRQMQKDFPPELIGVIMSTYYGGRSEIHIRREAAQVLYCDFTSMYPTVCTLMGLWPFVIAQGMIWWDSTEHTRQFLDSVTLSDLQQPETWRKLHTLVQVIPNGEIFPVRGKYDGEAQYTIGTNHLTSKTPIWYTLADCIAAKLLTGRAPQIVQATSFRPKNMQDGLMPVNIAGNTDYRADPRTGDFFKQVIDLRASIKKQIKHAPAEDKATLDSQQLALKILANSTSYGIFVEMNVEENKYLQSLLCHGATGTSTPIEVRKFESPGSFFNPLLATLITGAARLKLAITERLIYDAGLDWALCDTDSMAIAKPASMAEDEFYSRARQVQEWFNPLNPYDAKGLLLKIEDYNYPKAGDDTLQALHCYTISSKRYALYNLDKGSNPILRKVSAHGLGHLVAPYHRKSEEALEGVLPWQEDLWTVIIMAALNDHPDQPDYSTLKNFDKPAISRYGATTTELEKWFAPYNEGKLYRDRVKPFNFLYAMQVKLGVGKESAAIRPVAPYDKNHSKSLKQCFDRLTGKRVMPNQLKTYGESVAQYHLHPETKFLNGDYLDCGITQRRHIIVKGIQHIGKEANKWEEQYYIGYDEEAQLEYGISAEQRTTMLETITSGIKIHGASAVAAAAGISPMHVTRIYKGKTKLPDEALRKAHVAVKTLEASTADEAAILANIKALIAAKNIPIRTLAAKLEMDASNLGKVLHGKRSGVALIARIQLHLQEQLNR